MYNDTPVLIHQKKICYDCFEPPDGATCQELGFCSTPGQSPSFCCPVHIAVHNIPHLLKMFSSHVVCWQVGI